MSESPQSGYGMYFISMGKRCYLREGIICGIFHRDSHVSSGEFQGWSSLVGKGRSGDDLIPHLGVVESVDWVG